MVNYCSRLRPGLAGVACLLIFLGACSQGSISGNQVSSGADNTSEVAVSEAEVVKDQSQWTLPTDPSGRGDRCQELHGQGGVL